MEMNALKIFLHSPIQKLSKKGWFSPCGNHHYEDLMQHPKKNYHFQIEQFIL